MTDLLLRACLNAGLPAVMAFALAMVGVVALLMALHAIQMNRQTVDQAVRALQAHGRDDLVAELRAIHDTARVLQSQTRSEAA